MQNASEYNKKEADTDIQKKLVITSGGGRGRDKMGKGDRDTNCWA